jgi:hypothetical protein
VKNNRVENQQKFAQHIKEYIKNRIVEKNGVNNSVEAAGFDLMSHYTESAYLCLEYFTVIVADLEWQTEKS